MNERTRKLIDDDIRYLWHPFTQQKLWPGEPPVVIERAEGRWLVDTEGRKYFDGVSSLWVTVHGHCVAEINRAIVRQLEVLDHSTMLGLSHPPAIELARRLVEIAPGRLQRVFYSETGSTAVEVALKMAFQYWQHKGQRSRRRFVALEGAYHGDTLGAVSVGGIELFHQVYEPLLFDTYRLPQPYCSRCPLGLGRGECSLMCAEALEEILQAHAEEICAVIIEPRVQGAAGMIVQPEGYLKRIEQLCRAYGVLLIADEVATGFGRTGRMFACELEGVSPDLMAVGKGLSGGVLPLAATLATQEIYEAFLGEFEEFKTFFHGHTYTGNPLCCSAALASLDLMERENLLDNVGERARQLAARLEEIQRLEHVWEVRQQGLMVGIELVADRASGEPYPPGLRMGHRVIMAARPKGVMLRPLGDVVVLMPPLSSTAEEIDMLVDVVGESIVEVTEASDAGA